GVRPYAAYERDRGRLEAAILRHEPRLRVPDDVNAELIAIVDKLLAPRIENRYQTARQIAGDLQAYLEGSIVIAHIEALRANRATVRMMPTAPVLPRHDDVVPTIPLPRATVEETVALPSRAPAAVTRPVAQIVPAPQSA